MILSSYTHADRKLNRQHYTVFLKYQTFRHNYKFYFKANRKTIGVAFLRVKKEHDEKDKYAIYPRQIPLNDKHFTWRDLTRCQTFLCNRVNKLETTEAINGEYDNIDKQG